MKTRSTPTLAAVAPATPCYPLEYQPECWAMKKDTIYAARTALEAGLENTQELLADHDMKLGRTTRSNRYTAGRLEGEIRETEAAIEKLKKPYGTFSPFQDNAESSHGGKEHES
jgi:hypothetical protein